MVLHPNGYKNKGITDHISLYLVIADANSLRPGSEIRASFRLFMLDQNKDTYLTLQGKLLITINSQYHNPRVVNNLINYLVVHLDTEENGRRFHSMKLEWGFDKFMPLTTFTDPSNGYLVNDTCVVGAEVYVRREKLSGKGECLSMIKDAITYKNTWRIDNFSNLTEETADSKIFNSADHKW